MSKFEILQELANLKTLATRRSVLSRTAIVLGLAVLLAWFGRDGLSYLTTASRLVQDKVRKNIPVEFELERARTMIGDLVPEVRKNMLVIAEEEVAVADLRQQVEKAEKSLARQREDVLALRSDIDNDTGTQRVAGRVATPEDVRAELARQFNRYQTAEATLEAKRRLLSARELSLTVSRGRVESMLAAKRDLELQIENLDARLKTQQSQAVSSHVQIDGSQIAKCQKLITDLRVRLEVADRLLASQGEPLESFPASLDPGEEIGDQIDRYFSATENSTALADSRR